MTKRTISFVYDDEVVRDDFSRGLIQSFKAHILKFHGREEKFEGSDWYLNFHDRDISKLDKSLYEYKASLKDSMTGDTEILITITRTRIAPQESINVIGNREDSEPI